MDWNAVAGLVGVCLGGSSTIYNLATLRRLGLSEAHKQLQGLQEAALALQKEETAHWKQSYEVSQRKLAEQDRKIADQGECIETHRREIDGLKMLITQQAITQGYILREVVRSPELRAQIEANWTHMADVLGMQWPGLN